MPLHRLALALLVLTPAAVAQSWPTTSWEVRCGNGERWTLQSDRTVEPAPVIGDCTGPDAPLAATASEELQRVSGWLDRMGFRAPRVHPDPMFLAILGADEVATPMGVRDGYYLFYPELGRGDLVLSKEWTSGESVIAHELFHGVQAAYPFWTGNREAVADHAWVFEGTAQAVEYAWMRSTGAVPSFGNIGQHNYSRPLDQPTGGGYSLWHFWLRLGDVLDSANDLAYLHDLLASEEWGTARSLAVVDQALRTYDPDGLASLLPEVAARHLGDDQSDDYEMDGEFVQVEPGALRATREAVLAPLAIHRHDITVRPLGESHEIRIQVPDRPGLHLIVNGQRLDEGLGARNEYVGVVSGSDTARYRVLVVNVAPEAAASTEERYDLIVEATPIEACGAPYGAFASVSDTGAADANGRFEVVFEPTTVETAGMRYDTYHGLAGIRRASNRSYTWSEAAAREAQEGIERSQRMIRELGWENKSPTELRRAMAALDPATLARFFPEDDNGGGATLADGLGAGFTATITEANGDGTTALSFFNAEEDFNVVLQIFFSPQRGPGTYTAQTMVGVQAPFMRPGGAASAEGTQLYEPTVTFSTLDPEGCAIGTFSGSYLGSDNQPGTITGAFRVVVPPDASVVDIR